MVAHEGVVGSSAIGKWSKALVDKRLRQKGGGQDSRENRLPQQGPAGRGDAGASLRGQGARNVGGC